MHTKLTCITLFFITCNGIPKEKVRKENGKSESNIEHIVSEWERLENQYRKLGVLQLHKRVRKHASISEIIASANENDEYYDKGGTGYSDNSNDANYESKDWSDVFREDPVTVNYDMRAMMKHVLLSDIEGINALKMSKMHNPKRVKKRQAEDDLTDSYFDKGGNGENDNSNDDNYENQDWSDLYREPGPVVNGKNLFANLNETYIDSLPTKLIKETRTPKSTVRKLNRKRNMRQS